MLDNLQLLFVYAPVMNVQMILEVQRSLPIFWTLTNVWTFKNVWMSKICADIQKYREA